MKSFLNSCTLAVSNMIYATTAQRVHVATAQRVFGFSRLCLTPLFFLLGLVSVVFCQETPFSTKELREIQRIYVPVDQLGAAVTKDRYGAILTTAEFDKLVDSAIENSPDDGELDEAAIVHSANYDVKIDGERLSGSLTISISTFGKSWKEGRFDIAGWNIESATLNNAPATIARDGELFNVLRIFLQKPGKHTLKLSVSAPLVAQGGDKAANVKLIHEAAGEFRITLPAGKYLETDQVTLERPAEPQNEATYSIPIGGKKQLGLKITDRQKSSRGDLLTFASTAVGVKVLPSELTWIAKTEMQVFGREIDRLTTLIPKSLEITNVESNGLESWELADSPDDPEKTLITLIYRQGFEGRRGITFRGILSEAPDEPWSVPTLVFPSVTSHTGVIVVQHPGTLRLQAIESVGVRAIPETSPLVATGGVEETQLSYQIWDENFSLKFLASLKQQELQAAMTNVMAISQSGLSLSTTVSIQTRLAPLFEFRMQLPSEWEVMSLLVDGQTVDWQMVTIEVGDMGNSNELRIPLQPPLSPGQTRNISLLSRSIPENWPVKEETLSLDIPEVRLPQVEMVEALYGIAADADFELTTQEIAGLDPAGQKEILLLNQKLQAAGLSVRLAFTYQDTEFQGQLEVSRKVATLTAESITFFRVDPEQLFTRLEALLEMTGGGYRELTVLVSESAGEGLRFNLLPERPEYEAYSQPGDQQQQQQQEIQRPMQPAVRLVEQLPGDVEDGFRRWTLRFDRYLAGKYRLTTEVRTPRQDAAALTPVEIKFPASQMLSGYIAVEGSPEEHVQITAVDAAGKQLGGVDPVDFPTAHYQPQERVVAGYRHIHPGWQLSVSTQKFDRSAVPTVIGHSAHLTSVLSRGGEFQHQANIVFTAMGAQALLVKLPPDANLWSTLLDQSPVEIRRSPAGMQVPIAGLGDGRHILRLSYSTQAPALKTLGEFQTLPPSLSVFDGQGTVQAVELLSQDWQLHLPEETLLIGSDGLFEPVGRLFQSTLFSQILDWFRLPNSRSFLQRSWYVLIALLVLLPIWLLRRIRVANQVTGCFSKVSLLVGVVVLLGVVGVVSTLFLSYQVSTGIALREYAPEMRWDRQQDESAIKPFGSTDDYTFTGESGGIGAMEFELPLVVDSTADMDGVSRQEESKKESAETNGLDSLSVLRRSRTLNEPAATPAAPPSDPFAAISAPESATPKWQSQIHTPPPTSESIADAKPNFDHVVPSFGMPGRPADAAEVELIPYSNDGMRQILTDEDRLPERTLSFSAGRVFLSVQDSNGNGVIGTPSLAGLMPKGGLLSMTFDLQIPEGTTTQKFHYQGDGRNAEEVLLRVRVANRTTGQILIWSIALGVALLGWWVRGATLGMKCFWVTVTLLLPISLAWIVPVLWQLFLSGVLYGGLISLVLWSVRWCSLCCKCCSGWMTNQTCPTSLLLLSCLILSYSAETVLAQEKTEQKATAESNPEPPLPVEKPAPFVVIPYTSLNQIEAADRVWIPHATYRQLWESAHPEEIPIPNGPLAVTISEANYVGTLTAVGQEQQLAIKARWVISVLTDETVSLPLPILQSAIRNATINGETAVLDIQKNGQAHLILKGRGFHVVDAELSQPATVKGEVGEFSLLLLPVSSGVFSFELPHSENELRVRVDGLERVYRRINEGARTRIEFPVDRAGKKSVNWFPQTLLSGQNQIVQIETAIAVNIDDIGLTASHAFQTRVRQGALNDLVFAVPEGFSVRDIVGQDIGGWELNAVQGGKELKLFFRREITDQTEFLVNMFQNLSIKNVGTTLEIPSIAPQGVSRETLQLAFYASDHLKLRVIANSGLSQIDLSKYQPVVAPQQPVYSPLFAYRSSSRPIKLSVGVDRRVAEAKTEVEHGVHLARRKQLIATRILWKLTGSPRRRVDVALPAGYLPISVVCVDASDWYVHETSTGNILTVEFSTPKLGRIEVGLEGHLAKQPDETNVQILLPQPIEANGQTATLGIWLDPAYQASLAQPGDWKSIRTDLLTSEYQKLDTAPVQFAFRTDADNPQPVILNVQTALAKLTADVVSLIAVSDSTLDYGLTLRWNISQAAADEFVFTAPDWLQNIDIQGPTIRQIHTEDIGENRKRWRISLVDPVRGQYLLTVAATIPAPLDDLVRTPFIQVETATPDGSYQALPVQQQHAILVNLSPNQLLPVDLEKFESVSIETLPFVVHRELIQQAMEITRVRENKLPSWKLQGMEELSVAKAVVLSAHLETVVELDGSWRTLATYGIRNRGRQFLALNLPSGSRVLSVFVRGVPSRTVVADINETPTHLVALPQTSSVDLSFDVNLMLAGKFDRPLLSEMKLRGRQFSLPSPVVLSQTDSEQFGLPVTQTLWTVHLPREVKASAVTGVASTNLTPHETDAWLAVEKQTLDRLKADFTDLSRVVNDKSVSQYRRLQAKNNLKQLNNRLAGFGDEYFAKEIHSESAVELRDKLAIDNRELQSQAETAVQELEADLPQNGGNITSNGRGYILMNNGFLYEGNTASGKPSESLSKGTTTFNFLSVQDLEKSKAERPNLARKSGESRSGLKSQLADQGLAISGRDISIYGEKQSLLGRNTSSLFSNGGALQYQDMDFGLHPANANEGFSQQGGMGGGGLGGGMNSHWDLQVSNQSAQPTQRFQRGVQIDGVALGLETEMLGEQERSGAARSWSSTGGLSIAMELPKNPNTLSFSKVGGNPELTLLVRSIQTHEWLWGLGWCLLSLLVGLSVLIRFKHAQSPRRIFSLLAHIAILVGLIGFFCLPSQLVWVFFWVFCSGGFLKVLLSEPQARVVGPA